MDSWNLAVVSQKFLESTVLDWGVLPSIMAQLDLIAFLFFTTKVTKVVPWLCLLVRLWGWWWNPRPFFFYWAPWGLVVKPFKQFFLLWAPLRLMVKPPWFVCGWCSGLCLLVSCGQAFLKCLLSRVNGVWVSFYLVLIFLSPWLCGKCGCLYFCIWCCVCCEGGSLFFLFFVCVSTFVCHSIWWSVAFWFLAVFIVMVSLALFCWWSWRFIHLFVAVFVWILNSCVCVVGFVAVIDMCLVISDLCLCLSESYWRDTHVYTISVVSHMLNPYSIHILWKLLRHVWKCSKL